MNLTAQERASLQTFDALDFEVFSNQDWARLDHVLHRPDLPWLRTPAWLLRAALGEGIGELLINARVTPRRLQEAGYQFRSPTLPEALSAELAR